MHPDLIREIMNHRRGRKAKPRTGIATGSFRSKMGTTRRSRKGGITRRGGYAIYDPTPEEWDRIFGR